MSVLAVLALGSLSPLAVFAWSSSLSTQVYPNPSGITVGTNVYDTLSVTLTHDGLPYGTVYDYVYAGTCSKWGGSALLSYSAPVTGAGTTSYTTPNLLTGSLSPGSYVFLSYYSGTGSGGYPRSPSSGYNCEPFTLIGTTTTTVTTWTTKSTDTAYTTTTSTTVLTSTSYSTQTIPTTTTATQTQITTTTVPATTTTTETDISTSTGTATVTTPVTTVTTGVCSSITDDVAVPNGGAAPLGGYHTYSSSSTSPHTSTATSTITKTTTLTTTTIPITSTATSSTQTVVTIPTTTTTTQTDTTTLTIPTTSTSTSTSTTTSTVPVTTTTTVPVTVSTCSTRTSGVPEFPVTGQIAFLLLMGLAIPLIFAMRRFSFRFKA